MQAFSWSRRLLSAAGTSFPNAQVAALAAAADSGDLIKPAEALPFALEGVALAREVGDPVALARALKVYGRICRSAGDCADALTAAEEGLELVEAQAGPPALVAELLLEVGSDLLESGSVAAAEAAFKRAQDLARALGSHRFENGALTNLGEVARLRGDYRVAADYYREALAAGGFAAGFGVAMLNLGYTQLLTHDLAGARDALTSCLRQGIRFQQRSMLTFGLMGMAALEAISGDAARAARWVGTTERALGGAVVQAADRPILDLARETAEEKLGHRFAAEVEAGRAMDPIDAAREALASAPPSRQATAATAASRISARETEVLRLLAEGASNREIADRLVLSTRTVETHLANLYAKLGARSRVEALRLAVESGLLTLAPQEPPAPGKN